MRGGLSPIICENGGNPIKFSTNGVSADCAGSLDERLYIVIPKEDEDVQKFSGRLER